MTTMLWVIAVVLWFLSFALILTSHRWFVEIPNKNEAAWFLCVIALVCIEQMMIISLLSGGL